MIPTTLISKAGEQNKQLEYRLRTLDKFKVLGHERKDQIDETVAFLDKYDIAYFTNGEYLIWTPDLEDNIENILIKNMYVRQ